MSENRLWYRPDCSGSGLDGQVGPSPRAFHISIAIDCHMFIFGGRSSGKRYVGMQFISISVLLGDVLPSHVIDEKTSAGWETFGFLILVSTY